jgi:hypothetical protein
MQIIPNRQSRAYKIGRILGALGAVARWLDILRDLGLLDWIAEVLAGSVRD